MGVYCSSLFFLRANDQGTVHPRIPTTAHLDIDRRRKKTTHRLKLDMIPEKLATLCQTFFPTFCFCFAFDTLVLLVDDANRFISYQPFQPAKLAEFAHCH